MSRQSISLLALSVQLTVAASACRFVKGTGAQAAADESALGVARTAGAVGETVPVDVLGTAVVEAGGAFNKDDTIKVDAQGRAVVWAVSGAKVARALEASAGAGQFVEVLLIPNAA